MHTVQWNIKDWRNAVRGLPWLERQAYREMLEEFYDTERPLPLDDEELFRNIGVRTSGEEKAVIKMRDRFWIRTDAGFIQKRAAAEVSRYKELRGIKAANGRLGGLAKHKQLLESRLAGAVADASDPPKQNSSSLSNQKPETRNQKPETTHQPPQSAAEWANVLHALYGRRDAEMDAKQAIMQAIDTGTDPREIEAGVREVVKLIEERAPGGWANRYVPKGRQFWTEQQWRNPEAFAQRWDDPQKNKKGPADDGMTPPMPACEEPDGWREVWPDHFDFTPPGRWLDVPLTDRKQLIRWTAELQRGRVGSETVGQ